MEYKEQMKLYADSLKNTMEINEKEIEFLYCQKVFIEKNISYNKELNKSLVKNLENALKEIG